MGCPFKKKLILLARRLRHESVPNENDSKRKSIQNSPAVFQGFLLMVAFHLSTAILKTADPYP